jgi:hypothetical protein
VKVLKVRRAVQVLGPSVPLSSLNPTATFYFTGLQNFGPWFAVASVPSWVSVPDGQIAVFDLQLQTLTSISSSGMVQEVPLEALPI